MIWSSSGEGQMADFCDREDEPSGSLNCGEFIDYMNKY